MPGGGQFNQRNESIEVVKNGLTNPFGSKLNNFSERESLENFYTGTLATDLNRNVTSTGAPRGLSCHAVSSSL